MGRKAVISCTVGPRQEVLKVLLEPTELILLGTAIRHRWPINALKNVAPLGEAQCFTADGQDVALQLGSKRAMAWAPKMMEPPPTLAHKLGLKAGMRALVLGIVDDEALRSALDGATTPDAAQADLLVAVLRSADDLDAALAQHAQMRSRPVWMVHRKGKNLGNHPGDSAVRETCRARGYIDTKMCAVSPAWSATRYSAKATPP